MNSPRTNSVSVTVTEQRPSMAVVDLVARADGTDPIELEPLYDVIDPDVLDSLCESSPGFTQLEFTYHGRHVAVEAAEDDGQEVEISLEEQNSMTDGPGSVVNTESSI